MQAAAAATAAGTSVVAVSYARNDAQMISHILNKLPKMHYQAFTAAFGIQGISLATLLKFQDMLIQYWKNNIKNN